MRLTLGETIDVVLVEGTATETTSSPEVVMACPGRNLMRGGGWI